MQTNKTKNDNVVSYDEIKKKKALEEDRAKMFDFLKRLMTIYKVASEQMGFSPKDEDVLSTVKIPANFFSTPEIRKECYARLKRARIKLVFIKPVEFERLGLRDAFATGYALKKGKEEDD
jgi:hypothetical protein